MQERMTSQLVCQLVVSQSISNLTQSNSPYAHPTCASIIAGGAGMEAGWNLMSECRAKMFWIYGIADWTSTEFFTIHLPLSCCKYKFSRKTSVRLLLNQLFYMRELEDNLTVFLRRKHKKRGWVWFCKGISSLHLFRTHQRNGCIGGSTSVYY